MTSIEEADAWIGRTAHDDNGEQIGLISQIWVDDESGQPEWASVKGPALGAREALVPLAGTGPLGSGRQFAYPKKRIVDAPHAALDGRLGVEEKERLCQYYGPDPVVSRRDATWVDRIEETIPSDPGRQLTPPAAGADPDTEPGDGRGRFGRKPAGRDKKAGRRFGRKSGGPDQPSAGQPVEPDEVPIGG